jgi:hypothetical protein
MRNLDIHYFFNTSHLRAKMFLQDDPAFSDVKMLPSPISSDILAYLAAQVAPSGLGDYGFLIVDDSPGKIEHLASSLQEKGADIRYVRTEKGESKMSDEALERFGSMLKEHDGKLAVLMDWMVHGSEPEDSFLRGSDYIRKFKEIAATYASTP